MGAILTVSRLWFAAYQAFDQRKLGDDPDWISYFDAWELARKAVHCFQDLGQPRGTLLFIGQAIDPPTPRAHLSIWSARLACCKPGTFEGGPPA